jgi:hypothetical protein
MVRRKSIYFPKTMTRIRRTQQIDVMFREIGNKILDRVKIYKMGFVSPIDGTKYDWVPDPSDDMLNDPEAFKAILEKQESFECHQYDKTGHDEIPFSARWLIPGKKAVVKCYCIAHATARTRQLIVWI